jgi:dihydroorotate dehydrogenase (NAD+) catalytic subunit
MSVNLENILLNNPLVLASGVMGTSPTLLHRIALAGAGAVTAKSCGPDQRNGHPNPVMVAWEHGLINAIGLTNPGVEEEIPLLKEARKKLTPHKIPLIASIFAGTVDAYGLVTKAIVAAEPDMIEVNISCPNVQDDFGLPFAADRHSAADVTRAVKQFAGKIPITVKLAPNVPDIGRIAQAVVEAGANAITAINTMPGMIIDVDASQPVLFNSSGGISGPALKPIALHCIAEIARAVDVPIIGTGGVITGRDAIEMMMAGATAVGIGSALWYRGPEAFKLILSEMIKYLEKNKYRSVREIIGKALIK